MASIRLLVLGLLPALALTLWEALRRQRSRRAGSVVAPCAEGLRWALYAAAVYELGYAGLALAWLDAGQAGRGGSSVLVAGVLSTSLATLLLLWHFGERYAPVIPRLGDWREACYLTRLALLRRVRTLRYAAHNGSRGHGAAIAEMERLLGVANAQMHRLQRALSTQVFFARIRRDTAARAQLAEIVAEQRELLHAAHCVLAATAAHAAGTSEPVVVAA